MQKLWGLLRNDQLESFNVHYKSGQYTRLDTLNCCCLIHICSSFACNNSQNSQGSINCKKKQQQYKKTTQQNLEKQQSDFLCCFLVFCMQQQLEFVGIYQLQKTPKTIQENNTTNLEKTTVAVCSVESYPRKLATICIFQIILRLNIPTNGQICLF